MSDHERHQDIFLAIEALENLTDFVEGNPADTALWADHLRTFDHQYVPLIIELLDELRHERERSGGDMGFRNSFRTFLEGYSDESAAAALSEALNKASAFFSESHDISITLQKLVSLPEGGHRAQIEVHISPMTLRYHCHMQGPDVELKRIHDHEYYADRHYEEEHLQHLVFDHFAHITGGLQPQLPPFFLINITDSYLLNHMIENQFLKASHLKNREPEELAPVPAPGLKPKQQPKPKPEPKPKPRQVLVRTLVPEPKLVPDK